ncbi:MAG: hypothetical protein KJ069_31900 [Anaerolineae bacterium]|nr:hypothetical protein [Anaerolineae bacterium]
MSRPNIPELIQQKVLQRSRRRCCLCFGLEFDLSYKRVQIAHLDQDRTNNDVDNLVALCQLHHDEYDSVYRQTKRITIEEAKHYRNQLHSVLEQRHENLILSLSPKPGIRERDIANLSADLLGQVVAEFDREFTSLEKGIGPKGIALTRLAWEALTDFGDFDVAIEAFISILRLADANWRRFRPRINNRNTGIISISDIYNPSWPLATPYLAATRVLKVIAETDANLARKALKQSHQFAILGDVSSAPPVDYNKIPHSAFNVVPTVLWFVCQEKNNNGLEWIYPHLAERLVNLGQSLGIALVKRGLDLPNPPTRLHYLGGLKRGTPESQPIEWLPYVQLCNLIATLPQTSFEHAISREYVLGLLEVRVDEEIDLTLNEGIKIIERRAILPNHGLFTKFGGKTLSDKNQLETVRLEFKAIGSQVTRSICEFCVRERELLAE